MQLNFIAKNIILFSNSTSMKWIYKYCFNVHLDDDSMIEYYHFNAKKVNTILSITILIVTMGFNIFEFSIKVPPILNSTAIPNRYKIAVYLHLAIIIVLCFLQALNSMIFYYLKYGNLTEKQVIQLRFWSYFIQDITIITMITTFAVVFIMQVLFGECLSTTNDSLYCNESHDCQQLPFTVTTIMLLMPHAFPCLLTGTRFWAIVISFLITFISFIYTLIYMGIWNTSGTRRFLLYFILCSTIIIYETERQKLQLFLSNRDLQIQIVENQRLEKETRTSEMRYMIYNLGSTIKDVSLCLFSCTDIFMNADYLLRFVFYFIISHWLHSLVQSM